MWFDLLTSWTAMGASLVALFAFYGVFGARSLGEVAVPILSSTAMSGFAYLMWTV
jgi:hypothetical protein